MNLGDALVDMFTRYPLLRAALFATLTCWVLAACILLVTL
jgi:hypothetical protein